MEPRDLVAEWLLPWPGRNTYRPASIELLAHSIKAGLSRSPEGAEVPGGNPVDTGGLSWGRHRYGCHLSFNRRQPHLGESHV